jgi:hypothetical protein
MHKHFIWIWYLILATALSAQAPAPVDARKQTDNAQRVETIRPQDQQISTQQKSFRDSMTSIAENIISAILIAILFFIGKEYCWPVPQLSGCWTFVSETERTSLQAYKGMKLTYLTLLWQEGQKIYGSAEKVLEETASAAPRQYIGQQRTRVNIEGYLTKRYMRRSEVVLHMIEDGKARETSSIQELVLQRGGTMKGTFTSTAADSTGKVLWTTGRGIFGFDDRG